MNKLDTNQKSLNHLVTPAIIGNILEWYDFALYGYFATVISSLFFPSSDKTLSLLVTFAVFAIGFVMRPLGAILFGHYGDRYGRKKSLAFAVILMAIPTIIIGLLPTYETWGLTAGVMLIICRLLQGLAVGGEFTGSIVYICEHAPKEKRGFYASLTMFSAFLGLLLGSAVSTLVNYLAAGTGAELWAWRIPFISGFILGVVGLYLRLGMPETPYFEKMKQENKIADMPLIAAFKYAPIKIIQATLLVFLPAMSFYLLFVYLSSYLNIYLNIPLQNSLVINTICMMMIIIITPMAGMLADSIGRKRVLYMGAVGFLVFSYPLFILINKAELVTILFAQAMFGVFVAVSYAAVPATLVELFPSEIRYTAMSLPYNLANALFGGTAPMVATYMINYTDNNLSPSYYLILASIVMLFIVCNLRETKGQAL